MAYGLNAENQDLIAAKAKTKSNGIFAFRGVVYRVLDGKVTHLAWGEKIVVPCGNFNVNVGSYDGYTDAARRALKAI